MWLALTKGFALSLKELDYTSKDLANRLNVSKSTLLRNLSEFREAWQD